ncbi:hypothetical protein [Amycolatopsis cihanbeyliensis]|uniref:hypothetical protein n=1 Tax=Amycolatopsis cihanbeyliensis TaxID=1128664 RepID=UPI001153D6D0|nr:hypothetical protein [Amycolatopsis cihanbeyliensis]
MHSDPNTFRRADLEHERRSISKSLDHIKDERVKKELERYAAGKMSLREAAQVLDTPYAMRALGLFVERYESIPEAERDEFVKQARKEIEEISTEIDKREQKGAEPRRRTSDSEDMEDFDQIEWLSDDQ